MRGQVLCDLGWHRTDPAAVWNGGVGFSRCLRCRCELVRRPGARWTSVPHGHAVIWRTAAGAIPRASARTSSRSGGPADPASRRYRYLARHIATQQSGDTPVRTVLLSTMCDRGAANDAMLLLAAMMQDELGGRLLMIDATLGDDGIGAMLGAGSGPGLSEARAGDPWSVLEMLRLLPGKSMFVLGAGLDPGASRAGDMAGILPSLAGRFDHVLIQQRAITDDTRNLALAARADRVLVLAEEGRTPMVRLAEARGAFAASGIGDVGLILTVPQPASLWTSGRTHAA